MPEKLEKCVADFMAKEANKKKWPNEKDRRQAAYAICNSQLKAQEGRSFAVQLKEADDNGWVHLLTFGDLIHPVWGTITIDEEKVDNMITNFKNNVRGIQLDVDYGHKGDVAKGEKAAGWFADLEKRDDGLWGKIDWTNTALEEIQNGEWKYMSVEYDDEWCENKKDGKCYEDVLFGAALTNRPFVKDLQPINLSDLFTVPEGKFTQEDAHYGPATMSTRRCANCAFFRDGECLIVDGEIDEDYISDYFTAIYTGSDGLLWFGDIPTEEEVKTQVDPKQLRELLGLAEDATDEQVQARVKGLTEGNRKVVETLQLSDNPKTSDVIDKIAELHKFHEEHKDDEPKVDPKARRFEEEFPEQAKELAEQARELADARAERQLGEWKNHAESHLGLPPKLFDEAKALFIATGEPFVKFMGELIKTGFVDFSEKGSTTPTLEEGSDADAFLKEVDKYIQENKENKVSFEDAVKSVSRSHPKLAEAYRNSTRRAADGND